MAQYLWDATFLTYPILPLEIDLTVDGTSHSVDFKSQTLWSVTSSHISIRSDYFSFNHELRLTIRYFCDVDLLAYLVLPLKTDLTVVVYSGSPALHTLGFSSLKLKNP
jgi:hypothetical protein